MFDIIPVMAPLFLRFIGFFGPLADVLAVSGLSRRSGLTLFRISDQVSLTD